MNIADPISRDKPLFVPTAKIDHVLHNHVISKLFGTYIMRYGDAVAIR